MERSVAAYAYGGPVADAVVGAKAGGLSSVWRPLGRRLGEHLADTDPDAAVVVPLATDPRRRRQRGVDHTLLLAEEVAVRLGLPLAPVMTAAPGRPDQGERPLAERGHVDARAFRVRARVPPVPVLLVDDVLTTGGTAQAAAGALRRAGAARVTLAVVARAGRHPLAAPAVPTVPVEPPDRVAAHAAERPRAT